MGKDATIREFTRQAAFFEMPGSHFGDRDLLAWIASHIEVRPGDRVLDVAGGTGQLGRHLGRTARLTVVADLTPAILNEGARAARAEGRTDVVFVRSEAAALPFPDEHFEIVVSRFALHHLGDIGAVLREMRRVCRPGGSVTLVDMVAALHAEAGGGPATGLHAALGAEGLTISHRYLLLACAPV